MPRLKNPKAKGDQFERQLAAHLNDNLGTNAHRAPLSGGGFVMTSGGADLIGTPGIFVEAKAVERLNFLEAIEQAEKNIKATGAPEAPVVINRRKRMPMDDALVTMRMKDWLKFYRAWLTLKGYNPNPEKPQ